MDTAFTRLLADMPLVRGVWESKNRARSIWAAVTTALGAVMATPCGSGLRDS